MPFLDVSDILVDPDFCETITLRRRAQATNTGGINQITSQDFPVVAVVTQGGLDLQVQSDDEITRKLITVHTQTRVFDVVRAPVLDEPGIPTVDQGLSLDADGYMPDLVVWGGNIYTVRRVQPWSSYGAGFFAVECELQDLTSSPGTA